MVNVLQRRTLPLQGVQEDLYTFKQTVYRRGPDENDPEMPYAPEDFIKSHEQTESIKSRFAWRVTDSAPWGNMGISIFQR